MKEVVTDFIYHTSNLSGHSLLKELDFLTRIARIDTNQKDKIFHESAKGRKISAILSLELLKLVQIYEIRVFLF